MEGFTGSLGIVELEDAQVFERAELVVDFSAIIKIAVHLCFGEAQDEVGGAAVADEAFGAAGVMPGLLSLAAGGAGVFDGKGLIYAGSGGELGIGLSIVPDVGVAGPVLALL